MFISLSFFQSYDAIANNVNANDSLDKIKEFLTQIISGHFGNKVVKIKGNITIHQTNGKVVNLQLDNVSETTPLQEEPIDLSTAVDCRLEKENGHAETPVEVSDNSEIDQMEHEENGLEIDLKPSEHVLNTLDATIDFVAHEYEPPSVPSTSAMQLGNIQTRIDEYFRHEKDTHDHRMMAKELQRMDRRVKKRGVKKFQCNQCNVEFSSLDRLASHTTSAHETYRCMECMQTFTQRSNLQRHSLKHIGFKPFKCGVCDKGYYRKDHLVRHIEISHPGSDPKSNTRALISSAKCLSFISYCRNTGRDPSNREHLQDYNDSLGQWSIDSGDSSPVGHVHDDDDEPEMISASIAGRPVFQGGDLEREDSYVVEEEDEDRGQESEARQEIMLPAVAADAEDQYYETESGERILIVQPEPVDWAEYEAGGH